MVELGKGVLTSRIRIKRWNCRKGVLTSRIRINWEWSAYLQDPGHVVELRKEFLPSGSGLIGGTGKGSAYPQNPDQVVEPKKGVLTFRIRIKVMGVLRIRIEW